MFCILQTYVQNIANPPTIGFNFTAVSLADGRGGLSGVPQNPTMGVGASQSIISTYQALRSFNKFTAQPDGVFNIDAFAFSGNAAFGSIAQDVWLLYDRFSSRWYFSDETTDPISGNVTGLQLIVSESDPLTVSTQWATYDIPPSQINPLGGGSAGFIDYQQPAVDENAWYNGVATFDAVGNFLGSSLTVIPKSSILGGSPNITIFPGLFPEVIGFIGEGFALPALNFDTNPQYGYFLWLIYNAPDSNSGNQIQFYRILDAASNTPTLGPLVSITVPEFAYNGLLSPHKGNLFGDLGLLQTGLGSIMNYAHIRNHQLYLCQDLQLDSSGNASITGDRIGIRWYQFDMTGDPTGQGLGTETSSTVPVLIQSGTLYDSTPTNPLFYYLSSIMSNKNHDLVISFCTSGNNAYVNAGFAFRSGSDPLNTFQAPVTLTNTQFPLNFNEGVSLDPGPDCQRWGDQATVVTDPANDLVFWLVQPWAALQNAWGIQMAQIIPAS